MRFDKDEKIAERGDSSKGTDRTGLSGEREVKRGADEKARRIQEKIKQG